MTRRTQQEIGAKLRVCLAEAGLSVADLAAEAGLSKSATEKHLAGTAPPTALAIAAYADALSVDVSYLLFDNGLPLREWAHLVVAEEALTNALAALAKDLPALDKPVIEHLSLARSTIRSALGLRKVE